MNKTHKREEEHLALEDPLCLARDTKWWKPIWREWKTPI